MQKCTHREVRILLGGLVRLVGFFRTLLGLKVTSIQPKCDWLELKFSFRVDFYADGDSIPAGDFFPPRKLTKRRYVSQSGPSL